MKQVKKEKGITLIALVTTIIIILVLASIAITGGSNIIKKANLENLKTNLLLVEVKAKEALEQAVHELGSSNVSEDRTEVAKGKLIGDENIDSTILNTIGASENEAEQKYLRKFEAEQLKENMGIDGLEGTIVIEYDLENVKVEVYSSKGFVYDGTTYYKLSDIQTIEI